MVRLPARVRLALVLALGTAPLVAGDLKPEERASAARCDVSSAFGAQWADGDLWAGGPGFKARFDEGGLVFTPALGRTAPRNLPFGLSTRSVQRGGTLHWSAESSPPTLPSLAGNVISFARQPGLTERYEVRRDGLEQSFLLEAPLAGEGDLVVRLALDTELVAQPDGDGLRFATDFGGVRFGGVTGFDADGRRVAGQVRVLAGAAGAELELSLPAAFVSAARYPILLDPEITPIFPLVLSSVECEAPDVSYDASVHRWLATWAQAYSINDIDIRAAAFLDDGNLAPNSFWSVENASNTVALNPSVACLRAYNRWMIVWEQRPNAFASTDIRGCSISTFFGQSNTLLIAGTAANELHPDVGGHSSQQPTVVSVVWEANGAILHRTVFLANDPVIDLAANTEVLLATNGSKPRIASSGGDSMRLLVVCEKWYSTPAPGDHDVWGILIGVLGNKIAEANLSFSVGVDERTPDADGDGKEWGVAWAWAGALNWINAVRVKRVTTDGFTLGQTGLPLDFSGGSMIDDVEPSVAFTGNGYLMAWARQFSGDDYDIAMVGLNANITAVVDPLTWVDTAVTKARVPRVGSRYSSSHTVGDSAFVVWQTWNLQTGDGDVWGSLVEPLFGNVTNLGGGGPGGAKLSASAPKLGSSSFQHVYDGLYSFNQVTMIISLLPLNAPFCGGTLKVDPNAAIYFPLVTDFNTGVTLNTPIPADAQLLGLTFYEQWSEKDILTAPCGKKVQLSNALMIEIE